jgi:hypothetical protein
MQGQMLGPSLCLKGQQLTCTHDDLVPFELENTDKDFSSLPFFIENLTPINRKYGFMSYASNKLMQKRYILLMPSK